jgi:cardiolipin synthase A/B
MNILYILFDHMLPILGFLLALFLLVHIVRERRAPGATIAWLLAIVLIPYLGVPAYILFGGRKMKRMAAGKQLFVFSKTSPEKPGAAGSIDNVFPQRFGNYPTLLLSGEDAYTCLLSEIQSAKRSIYISTFIFSQDPVGTAILQTLTDYAKKGLDVCLLFDDLGSFKLSKRFLAQFKAAGGKYAFFMPMIHLPFRGRANLRNHRKMVIIDNSVAIIGGMNIAKEYLGPLPDAKRWNDISLSVRGSVVGDLVKVFASDWKFASGHDIDHQRGDTAPADRAHSTTNYQVVPSGPDMSGDALYDALLTLIFASRKRIWIVTPYFLPDEMMLKALCVAAARRIDVRLIVPEKSNHRLADLIRRGYLRAAQQAGILIYFYKPGMLHSKLILIDDAPAIIGSMNMDMRSFFLNYEIALFIYAGPVVDDLNAYSEGLMEKSAPGLLNTNIAIEFLESVFRLFAPLL